MPEKVAVMLILFRHLKDNEAAFENLRKILGHSVLALRLKIIGKQHACCCAVDTTLAVSFFS